MTAATENKQLPRMVYGLRRHMRLAAYNNDLVVLDLQMDRFHVIQNIDREALDLFSDGQLSSTHPLISSLLKLKAIEPSEFPPNIDLRNSFTGFFEARWMLPIVESTNVRMAAFMRAAVYVLHAAYAIKRTGMSSFLKQTSPIQIPPSPSSDKTDFIVRSAINALNKAFCLDFSGNRCLTYSLALRDILLPNIAAKVVIGIRTRPFLSHAWVEVNNWPVGEVETIRSQLSVIAEF
jgi:hypothetical protein